jgi:Flp pilus assembly protein TadG
MLDTVIFNRLRSAARRFAGDNQGNIALLFGIAAVPILTFVGAAIDYSRASSARTAMQSALDSTALMVAKDLSDGTIKTSDIDARAQAYFTALYTYNDAKSIAISTTYTASTSKGSTVQVNGTGNVTTTFMKVAGYPKVNFNTSSTAAWGTVRMRVALVLDVTGSMKDDGKMTAMKPAAKALIDQLGALAKDPGDVYISVVPFAKDVNVGATNYNQSWINWSDWDQDNRTCNGQGGGANCSPKNHDTWNGCVTDRDQDYDTTNTAPSAGTQATLFPAEQYDNCPVQLMGLSYDWTALNAKIDAMYPDGNTNQTIGLQWGFQSLTAAPFTIPAMDPNYTYKQVVILLTDGLNTENRFSTDQTAIDNRTKKACDNIKNAGIVLYALQVNTSGDPTSAMLQSCASDVTKFFLVTSSSQISTIFNQIGTNLSQLRIAK